jgi:DNA sulfur modification protein DndC
LLRYALTIDAEEREAAYIAGLPPRFELVPLKSLVAIDAIWSLQAMHRPFQAIKEYVDIAEKGIRYTIPDVTEYPRTPMPATRYLYVGDTWDSGNDLFSGMRDFTMEMLHSSDIVGGCMGNRTLKSGKIVLDVETEDSFDVDIEGACLAMDYEIDRMMEMYEKSNGKARLTEGYRWWIRMGTIALSPQQVSMHDEILKRSSFKEKMGLAGSNIDMDYIFSLTESLGDRTIPTEPLKFATEFKKENQLDIFSFVASDDIQFAA